MIDRRYVLADPDALAWGRAVQATGGHVSYRRMRLTSDIIRAAKAAGTWALTPNSDYETLVTATPQDILGAKLVAYVDAENNTQITQAGGFASAYADIINAASYAQATGASQPAVTTNAVTGRQVLRFDGTDDYLAIESIPTGVPTGANPCEMIAIVAQNGSAASTVAAYGTASNNGARRLGRPGSGNAFNFFVGEGASIVTAAHPGNFVGNHIVRGVASGTAPS